MSTATNSNSTSLLTITFDQWNQTALQQQNQSEDTTTTTASSLKQTSKDFFEKLTQSPTQVSLETELLGNKSGATISRTSKSFHNEALSQLIKSLGVLFQSSSSSSPYVYRTRQRGLSILCGAIQGCSSSTTTTCCGISGTLQTLLGNFLLGHCGPLSLTPSDAMMVNDNDHDEDENEDSVRDAAIECLTALVNTNTDITEEGEANTTIIKAISWRLNVAREGVERRCAIPEDTDMMDDIAYKTGYEDYGNNNNEGGLSTLVRSRRALCFNLLHSALKGIMADATKLAHVDKHDTKNSSSLSLKEEWISFATFCSNCLIGESDPRCLMQLLELLHKVQQTSSLPLLHDKQTFPTLSIFDAVAPYYPIQFTPPPNDIHGITRQGLQKALLNVLCFYDGDIDNGHNDNNDETNNNPEDMLNLSAILFLERLVPPAPEEDGSPTMSSTVVDKQEAIDDLMELLFPSPISSSSSFAFSRKSNCEYLDTQTLSELSVAVNSVHAEASSLATPSSSDTIEGSNQKKLADTCRTLVSMVAYHLEMATRSNKGNSSKRAEPLWTLFVLDAVQKQSPLLSTSPQSLRGRTAVAYLACLAASGGTRTLRVCLDACLVSLLEALTTGNQGNTEGGEGGDPEKVVAAAYGLGAFFSSCRAALERRRAHMAQEGNDMVVLHPHPLEDMGGKVANVLCQIVLDNVVLSGAGVGSNDINYKESTNISICIAAVRAMGSVLLSTPSSVLHDDTIELIKRVLEVMTSVILQTKNNIAYVTEEDEEMKIEWPKCCACTIGRAIGKSLANYASQLEVEDKNKETASDNCIIDDNEIMLKFVQGNILDQIKASAISEQAPKNSDNHSRFDWMTLAFACEMNLGASLKVMSSMTESLESALHHNQDPEMAEHPAVTIATALSFLLCHGGPHTPVAFHDNSDAMGIIDALCSPPEEMSEDKRALLSAQLSRLPLITTTGEEAAFLNSKIHLAFEIVPRLLPAYQSWVPDPHLFDMGKYVTKVLPPLSEWDNVKLDVALPLLSAALATSGNSFLKKAKESDQADTKLLIELLHTMVDDLTRYSLSRDNALRARSAAASCLHSIVADYQLDNTNECLSVGALTRTVLPSIVATTTNVAKSADKTADENQLMELKDSMNLASLLASAAACRGKSSTIIADQISKFLVEITCSGRSELSLNKNTYAVDMSELNWTSNEWANWPAPVFLSSSSAFGSILSVEHGGPFWRQRISHMASKYVMEACSNNKGTVADNEGDAVSAPPLGPLVIACHIICSCKVASISKPTLHELASIVTWGLASYSSHSWECNNSGSLSETEVVSVIELIIAAIIKLMTVAPDKMQEYLTILIPNLLLIYSAGGFLGDDVGVPAKLMALQCLLNMTTLPNGTKNRLAAFKPAVVAILAEGLDDSSSLLRHAAVDARLSWMVQQ